MGIRKRSRSMRRIWLHMTRWLGQRQLRKTQRMKWRKETLNERAASNISKILILEVKMIELDSEESDSDEVVECEEEENDDIQVGAKVPVEHLEGAAKERKSSEISELNSLLDSDNDDPDAPFEK